MTAVIAITSGKANVGSSMFSANLAHYLNQRGYRTGVLVAGNDRPYWGVAPDTTWPNIITGRLSIDHAIQRDIFGIDLMVTKGHGHALGNLSTHTAGDLADPLGLLNSYAYLIVDMAAGISSPAIACCLSATEAIMVLTPEAKSLSSGYEWLSKLARHGFKGPANMVLNQVRKPAMAQTVFARFKDLAQKKLNIQTNLWGSMALERQLNANSPIQQPLTEVLPQSNLLQSIGIIGDRLLAEQPPENQTMSLGTFWRHFIKHLEKLPNLPFAPATAGSRGQEPQQPQAISEEAAPPSSPEAIESEHHLQQHRYLERQLAAIFDELRAIRHLMENRPSSKGEATNEVEPAGAEEIPIDFDEFIKDQKDI